ncbi:AlpA family transcriptional regulator [Zoogloea sp. LCSB751]|uniref:helix-turn-helix transcriptional regulator n=1 Tax=Zoogloea sp. LCSB751 TaxID=1965277 RepID=UPI0009A4DF10|nr:AlpA family transcriptional regulator [Zoogloea sp. LCSB751]
MATQQAVPPAPVVILRRREVEARTGLGCSTIYDGIKAGTFPAPIQLGSKSVGWIQSEIDAWLAARIAERDSAGTAGKAEMRNRGRK